MSSIREALKRAERERRARLVGDDSPPSHATAVPEADPVSAVPEAAPARRSDPTPADLRVVHPNPVPLVEVPIELTEELGRFRHAVESALPQPHRTVAMTSANGGEGTTTLTVLLGTSLAVRDGRKTCIVDANFKSPRASNVFGLLGQPGYSDYCTGKAELSRVLRRTESPDLFVMGIGTDVLNPSLVLSHERARGLASELGQRFDYVLFDCGPALTTAETTQVAATVDGTVLVVRAHRTKREVLAKAEKMVRLGGGSVIGAVLNRRHFPIPEQIYRRL
ncbi:MAG TPA: CpsD/CapB family tyrosine-protein kinase [Candidatus Krumholzibacteria bacterium]|nr:CpsD/CapB family tyrosine-protein kinase [Candidatus Krumholzibacteria bacterium]